MTSGQPRTEQDASRIRATRILTGACAGDTAANTQLMPLVYSELRRIAAGYLRHDGHRHTLQPTALVHEAWVRLGDETCIHGEGDEARARFIGIATRSMR